MWWNEANFGVRHVECLACGRRAKPERRTGAVDETKPIESNGASRVRFGLDMRQGSGRKPIRVRRWTGYCERARMRNEANRDECEDGMNLPTARVTGGLGAAGESGR